MRKIGLRIISAALAGIFIVVCLGAERRPEKTQKPSVVPMPPISEAQPIQVKATSATCNTLISGVAALEREPVVEISEYEAELIAKTLYGECRGCADMDQAAVVWCILNRADNSGQSVEQVITSPNQFMGYSPYNPVEERLYNLAADVLRRHELEKQGVTEAGRILPKEYLWFAGDGSRNHFRDSYSSGNVWDWSLPNPYLES